jgi:hypothetical protein
MKRWTWLFLGLLLIVTACRTVLDESELDSGQQFLTVTSLPQQVTPTPSATPLPSSTPTAIATRKPTSTATLTRTLTPTPAWTPLPTVAPQQRGELYNELMSTNGGCALPCWWGFELGVAALDQIRQFYTVFDAFITEQAGLNGASVLYITFADPQIEDGRQVRHTFVAQDSIVIEAEIQVWYDLNYQIEPLLQQLEQPSELWMWTIPDAYEGVLPANFLLYFPESGVLAGYAVFAERVDDVVRACFDERGATALRLWDPTVWDPAGDKGLVERANESGSTFSLDGYFPIEEASNWDAGQFYSVLTDPNRTECLQTPSSLWSPP